MGRVLPSLIDYRRLAMLGRPSRYRLRRPFFVILELLVIPVFIVCLVVLVLHYCFCGRPVVRAARVPVVGRCCRCAAVAARSLVLMQSCCPIPWVYQFS